MRLELLEPVPNSGSPNIIQQLPAQTFRGRLGTGHLMPELEEALATMTRGERQIVTLHYPLHHPYATLRLQQRILAVTLLDHKSYRTPPVVEREMFVGKRTGPWLDTTSLAVPQLVDLLDTDAVPA